MQAVARAESGDLDKGSIPSCACFMSAALRSSGTPAKSMSIDDDDSW